MRREQVTSLPANSAFELALALTCVGRENVLGETVVTRRHPGKEQPRLWQKCDILVDDTVSETRTLGRPIQTECEQLPR